MGMMRPGSVLVAVLGCLCAAACSSTQARDLSRNENLYQDTGFRSQVPGDRSVFVTPMADARAGAALPQAVGGFPIVYDQDGRWERPAPTMLAELLRRELQQCAVFQGVSERAEPGGLVLKPSLVRFHSGTMETVEGGRSLAEVALRVQVYGPEHQGRRPLWFDQVFTDAQQSDAAMIPVGTFQLTGRSVRNVLRKVVVGLDGSNVSRTGVPLEVAEPAEPTAPADASAGRARR